jgi:hypothetical protein
MSDMYRTAVAGANDAPNNGMHPTADKGALIHLQRLGASGGAWRRASLIVMVCTSGHSVSDKIRLTAPIRIWIGETSALLGRLSFRHSVN